MGTEGNQGKDKGESKMTKDFWEHIDRLEELANKATQGNGALMLQVMFSENHWHQMKKEKCL